MHLSVFCIDNAPTLTATIFCLVAFGLTLVAIDSRWFATGSLVVVGLYPVAMMSDLLQLV
jgi:hypothetical protein